MNRTIPRTVAITALLLIAVLSTACGSNGLLQRWIEAPEPARQMIMKDINATVQYGGRSLPTGAELMGTVVLVVTGGVDMPLVCMGVLERRCLDFRKGDEVLLNEVMLREGSLRVDGRDYTSYWLAVDDRGVRRSMR